jgi:competence protein ComEC
MTGACRSVETIPEGYGEGTRWWRQPLPGTVVLAVAVAAVVGAHAADTLPTVAVSCALAAAAVLVDRRVRLALGVLVIVAGVAAASRGQAAVASLAPDRLGPFEGWIKLVDDPQPRGAATRVVAEVDGERFEIWARGRSRQSRVRTWRAGERVAVAGERVALRPDRAGRVAWQHVVGELRIEWTGDVTAGSPAARASNRIRELIERGASVLPADDAALLRGLVVGDDRDQPPAMLDRFRASGLSHLTAVSGQNVAFVLAALGPLLRRLRPAPRWAATVGMIAWFAALTRFEPSILRAGVMAGLSATAYALGRDRGAARLLALAVTGLVLVDPLLTRSIGFWLSVGATTGVCVVGPVIASRLSPLGALATPIGITLGAQAGVLLPSVLVFGGVPLVSLPANVVAVPVAGFVMLYGLPAALAAGVVVDEAPWLATVLLLPARVGVRWVDTVAALGQRVEPSPTWRWLGWAAVVVAVVAVARAARRRRW